MLRFYPLFIYLIFRLYSIDTNPQCELYNLTETRLEHLKEKYEDEVQSILYRRIPRRLVPELEPILREILPIFSEIKGINITRYFPKGGIDHSLQKKANKTNLSEEELNTLFYYEISTEYIHGKNMSDIIKKKGLDPILLLLSPLQIEHKAREFKDWTLKFGRLTYDHLYSIHDISWYKIPFLFLSGNYQKPIHIRFYDEYCIKITGLFYYPPGGYATWHTNQFDLPGWRLYYTKTKKAGQSWFRYKNPNNDTYYTVPDKNEHYNLFRITSNEDMKLWHSVYSDTDRFSVGMQIPDALVYLILARGKGDHVH